jgi:hypothetical protein
MIELRGLKRKIKKGKKDEGLGIDSRHGND